MNGFWLGFTAWLGKVAAELAIFVAVVGIIVGFWIVVYYVRRFQGWYRWKLRGETCGYNVHHYGPQYGDCDRPAHHDGAHQYSRDGMRFAFGGDSAMHWSRRIDLVVPPSEAKVAP